MWRWTMVVAAGCSYVDTDEVQTLAESDTVEVARTLHAATTPRYADPLDLSGTVQGLGTCAWDWSIEGPAAGAAMGAAPRFFPCGGEVVGLRGTFDVEVTGAWLSGDVSRSGENWAYELVGARDATSNWTSPGGSERMVDAHWTLQSLVGQTDGREPGPFDAVMLYDRQVDGVWRLEWSVDDNDDVTGLVTGPQGATCTMHGTRHDIAVEC